jgi:hypothetical protein
MFFQVSMQECRFDIQLENKPQVLRYQCNHQFDCVMSCNGSKNLCIINPIFLLISHNYQTCLILINFTIFSKFCFENPLYTNGFVPFRKISQLSNVISFNGINFIIHCLPSIFFFNNTFKGCRITI